MSAPRCPTASQYPSTIRQTSPSPREYVIVMSCRTSDTDSIGPRFTRSAVARPVVLLALQNDDVRARFGYQLTALGFDVVMRTADPRDRCRPDVIVTELTVAQLDAAHFNGTASSDEHFRAIPAAVCLASCSGAALSAGIHAVLGG
jgi:hypothetical protein